ncbi:MAG: glycosyltransferase family 9 protein [Rhodospirillales bacterium]|nr:glycosyltransferase family 9 protein [Rhodospirillales bacterium]
MKILFITATRIGDAVLTTGLLDHLITTYPQARITVAAGPIAAPLFQAVPGVEQVFPMPKKKRGGHWLTLWSQVVGNWWDMVVDLRGSAIAYTLLASKRFVIGAERGGHRVMKYANVLKLKSPPAPTMWTNDVQEKIATELIPQGSPVLAIGPTANWIAKTWRPEFFVELINRLTGPDAILPNARIALLGAENEREAAAPVLNAFAEDRMIDLMGKVDLPTASACLKRCNLYIGNDSGLMHLSSASKTPTLGLFGPSKDEFYAPWGEKCSFVRAKLSFDEIFGPNSDENFNHETTGTLMDTLTVDMAEQAANELWRKIEGSPS